VAASLEHTRPSGKQAWGLKAPWGAGICSLNANPNRESPSMSTFDERESAFENKFAHDAEMQFKAEARRNKLLGLWAAELLGKTGEDAQAYAKEVVKADFEEAGHEDVVRKVAGDLGSKSTEQEIRAKMSELLAVAKAQLLEEH
jgi:hypothetical protein